VAISYDSGQTWTTADATPTDPVQRGCIWNQGGSNPCRNLLDFNDITVDKFGRVLVGYADGCTGSCVTDPTQNASAGPASAQDGTGDDCAFKWRTRAVQGVRRHAFGTRSGNIEGHGRLCFGDPASGIQGDPGCKASNR